MCLPEPQVGSGERLLVERDAGDVTRLLVEPERLLQYLEGSGMVTGVALDVSEVRQSGGESGAVANAAGDGGAFFKQGACLLQVAEQFATDAKAVELTCLLISISAFARDRETTFQVDKRPFELSLLLHQDAEPVGDFADMGSGLVPGCLECP